MNYLTLTAIPSRIWNKQTLSTVIVALFSLLALTLLGDASAAGDATVSQKAGSFLCRAYQTLNGPIGWGLGLLMIAFGAVMLMTGNRNANGIIISAILGGIVLAASGTLLGFVLSKQADACLATETL